MQELGRPRGNERLMARRASEGRHDLLSDKSCSRPNAVGRAVHLPFWLG